MLAEVSVSLFSFLKYVNRQRTTEHNPSQLLAVPRAYEQRTERMYVEKEIEKYDQHFRNIEQRDMDDDADYQDSPGKEKDHNEDKRHH